MKIKIINKSDNPLPEHATQLSAGLDLRANLKGDAYIRPFERVLIGTGLHIEIPQGYEGQIRPRSGLAKNHGVTILNSPGTIDADYRGEIKVLLINLSHESVTIKNGERIAQLVIAHHETIEWETSEVLSESERGEGGYGHTGKN